MGTENAESNDLMPFKNLFNEWFVRDTSRKIERFREPRPNVGSGLAHGCPTATKRTVPKYARRIIIVSVFSTR